MDISTWVKSGITLFGLLLSLYFFYKKRRSLKLDEELKQSDLDDKKRADIDSKKAHFNIEYKKTDSQSKLIIHNSGKASATNIVFTIPERINHPLIPEYSKHFPYKSLASGKSIVIPALIRLSTPKKHTAQLTWDDEFQKNRKQTFELQTH